MSRIKKRAGSSSPVKKYVSFAGGKGKVKFHDKEHKDADEKGNVYLDSIDFVVLDIKSSISGFNEKASASINSNLLDPYSVGKEEFVVKTKVDGKFDVFAQGVYKEIKDEVIAIGGKFTTNIFALADLGDGQQIIRLELNGSGLSPWIEFTGKLENQDDLDDLIVTIGRGQLCTRKKGKTVPVSDAEYKKIVAAIKKDPLAERPVLFYEPAFQSESLPEDLAEQANEADEVLQKYFDESGTSKPEDIEVNGAEDVSPKPAPDTAEDDDDDLPF